jgi:hypothetical protein
MAGTPTNFLPRMHTVMRPHNPQTDQTPAGRYHSQRGPAVAIRLMPPLALASSSKNPDINPLGGSPSSAGRDGAGGYPAAMHHSIPPCIFPCIFDAKQTYFNHEQEHQELRQPAPGCR